MKFTDGYWMLDPNFEVHYALQYERHRPVDGGVEILASCRPVNGRGDMLDGPLLTVTLTAPMNDVIRVKVEHFRGAMDRNPRFETYESPADVEITEDAEYLTFRAGRASAVVTKAPWHWNIAYCLDGKTVTNTGYRSMAHIVRQSDKRSIMCDSMTLDVGEKVYGLGEQFTPFVKNGQSVDIWNADGGTSSNQAYKCIPFYMTNRNYGILVESSTDVSFEVASEKVERVQFSHPGETMVYDVFVGDDQKQIISLYTALTGRPALPPAWSFGLWLSTSFTTSYDEQTVNSFIDGMSDRDIPLSVFHFDCYWMKERNLCDLTWNPETFPDPEGMLKRLHEKGLHICCWINSYIAQQSPLFDEGMAKGYFLKKKDGSVWQSDRWEPGMAILDVTNPDAVTWYSGYLKKLLDQGVDCFKTDFGERIPVRDVVWFDGSDPLGMHNYYTFLYNKMVFDLLLRERGEGEAVLFARSATVGGQQFPVHWNGDSTATYVSMAETLRSGLAAAQSGIAYWSHDISGFESTAPADVYKRWSAFGLLSSHSRFHGSSSYRVPWLFDEESVDVVRKFTRLKCSLMPYLFGKAVEAHTTGVPMLRPMVMEFPGDVGSENCETQYMMGDKLLVAPIFHKDGHVDYWLPAGKWTNLLTGKVVEGNSWQHEVHDFMSLPLMVREGAILPMSSHDETAVYDYTDGLTLHVFCPVDGVTTVTVPDTKGNVAGEYVVTVSGGQVSVETKKGPAPKVEIHQ